MKFIILTIIVGVVFAGYVDLIQAATLPDYVIPCKRNDPNIDKCIVNAVNHIKPHLKNGIKDLNVPAMEPLSLGTLNILESGSSGINVKAIDLNIYGASNFEIRKFKISDDGLRYDFELNLPHLEGEGHYDISGKILTLPIKGRGPFTGNFDNFYAFVKLIVEKTVIDGEEYLRVKDLQVKVRTGKGNINLQNLFNGDKTLGDVVNDTINQNFELFTNELIGPIERALDKKFLAIARKIMENFTYNELFPTN
uniref:Uncharacterized protein n=1 Tax=Glossina pallidipes TaxID=7398 RepID=A0A1A9Z862_GLOPL